MSDTVSKEVSEDKNQEHEEEEGDTTSSQHETTAKDKLSNESETDDLSSGLARVTLTERPKGSQDAVQELKDIFLSLSKDEKRALYKCKDNYVLLDNIQTWPELYQHDLVEDDDLTGWWERNKTKVMCDVEGNLNDKISLFRGDITTLEIDAIVNAAHESLLGGGGVDGAIHAAAGRHLLAECRLIGGCENGDAEITCGYNLPAKYVIHTVGPRGFYPEILESCYTKCLNLVKENQLKSVAFPCISTGIFGFPNKEAAIVALRTVRKWLETEAYAKNIERILFCLFLQKDVDIYHRQTQRFFPLIQDEAAGTNN